MLLSCSETSGGGAGDNGRRGSAGGMTKNLKKREEGALGMQFMLHYLKTIPKIPQTSLGHVQKIFFVYL